MRSMLVAAFAAVLAITASPSPAVAADGVIHFQSARGIDCYYTADGSGSYGGKLGGAPRNLYFTGGVTCNRPIPEFMVWTNIFNERLGEPVVPPMEYCDATTSCFQNTHQVRTDTLDTYYASFNFNVDLRGSGDTWTVWPPFCTFNTDRNYLNCLLEPAAIYYPSP
jgi:hypothetical protein